MLILAKVDLFLKSASCLILVLVKTRVGIQISWDSCGVNPFRFLSLKVSKFHNEFSVSKIFQKCNENIVRLSAQKYKKCSNQTNKDILLCQIAPKYVELFSAN